MAGVTERGAACKPRCRISHTAHRRVGVTAAQRRSFTRYRRSTHADARAGVPGNGASSDLLPRAHGMVVFLLPLRIGIFSIASGRVAASAERGGSGERQRRRHDDPGNCANRCAATPMPTTAMGAASFVAAAHPTPTARTNVGGETITGRAKRAAGQASVRGDRGGVVRGIAAESARRAIAAHSPVAKRRVRTFCTCIAKTVERLHRRRRNCGVHPNRNCRHRVHNRCGPRSRKPWL